MKGWLALCCAVCMLIGAMAAAESPTENGFSALELPADEILDMNLDRNRGTEAIQWTQTEDGAGVKMTVAEEDGTQAEWSMDCSQGAGVDCRPGQERCQGDLRERAIPCLTTT